MYSPLSAKKPVWDYWGISLAHPDGSLLQRVYFVPVLFLDWLIEQIRSPLTASVKASFWER